MSFLRQFVPLRVCLSLYVFVAFQIEKLSQYAKHHIQFLPIKLGAMTTARGTGSQCLYRVPVFIWKHFKEKQVRRHGCSDEQFLLESISRKHKLLKMIVIQLPSFRHRVTMNTQIKCTENISSLKPLVQILQKQCK